MNEHRHIEISNSELLRGDTDCGRNSDAICFSASAASAQGMDGETAGASPALAVVEHPRLMDIVSVEPVERGDEGLPSYRRLIMTALVMMAIVMLLIKYTLP
jgi:hypothetical protein